MGCERAESGVQGAAMCAVLGNSDLVAHILAHAGLDPSALVAAGQVNTTWRAACRADTTLLLAAARQPAYLTKRSFAGLFALTQSEADNFPRGMRARRPSGFMYMYRDTAISAVLSTIGGLDGWKCRLATRARLTSDEAEHTRKRPRCMYSGMSNDFNRRTQLAT